MARAIFGMVVQGHRRGSVILPTKKELSGPPIDEHGWAHAFAGGSKCVELQVRMGTRHDVISSILEVSMHVRTYRVNGEKPGYSIGSFHAVYRSELGVR